MLTTQALFSCFREQMLSTAMGKSSNLELLAEARFKNFLCSFVKDYCDIYLNKQKHVGLLG
ncbi:MAG: hypothetical protein LBH25_11880 [Fibromonadaceae bacterium]|nr:hypothetical protein [Fibromonadaceae bacterium]